MMPTRSMIWLQTTSDVMLACLVIAVVVAAVVALTLALAVIAGRSDRNAERMFAREMWRRRNGSKRS